MNYAKTGSTFILWKHIFYGNIYVAYFQKFVAKKKVPKFSGPFFHINISLQLSFSSCEAAALFL